MKFYQKIKDWFTPKPKGSLKGTYLNRSTNGQNKKGIRWRLQRQFTAKTKFEIDKWEDAMMQAKDPNNPNRYELYSLYAWALLDAHLFSQVRTAHITIQRSAFEVYKNGRLDEKLTDLFKRPWFIQYIKHILDAEFWGYSLVEFDPNMDNGEFTQIHLIEREHVKPETREVLLRPFDQTGICYTDQPFNKWLIGIGEPNDLGLLELATKEIIYKEYSRRDWSIRSEKFGMPFIIIKTTATKESELDEKEEMAANFGSNGYALLDSDDEFELIEPKNSGGHDIYKDKAEYCDKNISKLINGQTSTSDEKSFAGSAAVHERLLNDYSYSRLRRILYHINFELFPFLIQHGYPLKGAKLQFKDLIAKTKESSNKDTEPKENEEDDLEKKKRPLNKIESLYLFYNKYKDSLPTVNLSIDLDKIINGVIKKVHNKQLKSGSIDANTWQSNVQEIWKGVQEGLGKNFVDLNYSDPAYELMATFRNNIQVFAAFKNHQEIGKLVALLKDETGATRSFADFKEVAEPVIGQYNDQYLEAEYNHAIASAQMADKWLDFEKDKALFPYLTYKTQKDERVRKSHQKLDGITLPVEHDFWDSFFPANDWGCRCFVAQTDNPDKISNDKDLPSIETVPAAFRNNPARSGELFTSKHPYFEGMDVDIAERIIKQKNQFVYNSFDGKQYNKLSFDPKTGGYAVKHKKHKASTANEETAKALAKKGNGIELLKNATNAPDAIWGGKVWAFQHIANKSIEQHIKEGSKRANRVLLVLSADNNTNIQKAISKAVEGTGVKEIGILKGAKLDFIITE